MGTGRGWLGGGAAVAVRIWQQQVVVFRNLDIGQEVSGSVVTMVLLEVAPGKSWKQGV